MKIVRDLLITLFILFFIYLLIYRFKPKPEITKVERDTTYITNTITKFVPKYFIKEIPINKIDTLIITETDTIKVQIPITQKVYEDSLYKAYISGYKQSLDSIDIFVKERNIVEYKTITEPNKRFFIGPSVMAGFGLINGKFDVSVGISAGFRF